ncbi:hypothetical protein JCM33374_g3434 [Metschnikowia sp. JCM 33374]|nr:hypothetical protein JCM33374_g3434 [Metschnikowia sp. JCM 33374]
MATPCMIDNIVNLKVSMTECGTAGSGTLLGSLEYNMYESSQRLLNGKFMYLHAIQTGSFGKVTLALDISTNTKVAIKAMHKSRDVEIMARHEIKVLRMLGKGNPHICQLLEDFETEDFVILILEYCENGDLYELLHSPTSALHEVDIWKIAQEMYSAVTYSHSLGVYHRDIKPENILFTDSGRVKICDWGLSTLSRHSTVFNVGTEKYMAPECFLHTPISSGSVDKAEFYDCKAADYWSFGITLLMVIFGRCPFKSMGPNGGNEGGSHSKVQIKSKHVEKSLKWDTNFKNFVFYNKPEVLYDIYPDMNKNCFNIFMNVLKVGGMEDDVESFNMKIKSRNLDKFIKDLESNFQYGFTVWDEDELLAEEELVDDGKQHESAPEESIFNMDDLTETKEENPEPEVFNRGVFAGDREKEKIYFDYFESVDGKKFENLTDENNSYSLPVPSLTESSYQPKSWYDLADNLDDNDMSKLLGGLSFRDVDRIDFGNTSVKEANSAPDTIHILDKEVGIDRQRLRWSDY